MFDALVSPLIDTHREPEIDPLGDNLTDGATAMGSARFDFRFTSDLQRA